MKSITTSYARSLSPINIANADSPQRTSDLKAGNPPALPVVAEGELVHIKVLDYIGNGKSVIDFKGQRVVASSGIPLEKDRELSCFVRSVTGDRIVLQISASAEQEVDSINTRTLLGDVIQQLMVCVENFMGNSSLPVPFLLLLQRAKRSLQRVIVNIRGDGKGQPVVSIEEESDLVRDSITAIGYDYERRLANAGNRNEPPMKEDSLPLRAELVRLLLFVKEEKERLADPFYRKMLDQLLKSLDDVLESIESLSIKSASEHQKLYIQIPVVLDDQRTTAEIELFRQNRSKRNHDDSLNATIRLSLNKLGRIEFIVNLEGKDITCQIKVERKETFLLVRERISDLERGLTALGYCVNGIYCVTPTSIFQGKGLEVAFRVLDARC